MTPLAGELEPDTSVGGAGDYHAAMHLDTLFPFDGERAILRAVEWASLPRAGATVSQAGLERSWAIAAEEVRIKVPRVIRVVAS